MAVLTTEEKLNNLIDGITAVAEFSTRKLPITEKELAEMALKEAAAKSVSDELCPECGTKLILNVRISRVSKRPESYGTSYCPQCKVTNKYRRYLL
jgi:ssDNA-binding Zn-finger/Zn-ribbon topoisomerase 1